MNVMLLRNALALPLLGLIGIGQFGIAFAQEADESALDALDKNAPPKVIAQNEAPGAKELREAMRRIAEEASVSSLFD